MKFGILWFASAVNAHTLFTTLFINGKNQGDGTCVRMPRDSSTANGPIHPIIGNDMACGRDGGKAVAFTCAAPQKATLTFQFRMVSNSNSQGAIAPGHKGPCAVYLKRLENMQNSSSPSGPGWFKIWEDGYNATSGKWCVDRLIENKGLLSVNMPYGLPVGYYLVRPEILALHNAVDGDPQFYLGCAQIYIRQGPRETLDIPKDYSVSIPGYISADTPSVKFNIYQKPMPDYTIPGPRVFIPQGGTPSQASQGNRIPDGVPNDCILKNANWCAKAVPGFSTEDGCWASVKICYNQSQVCWDTAPPSGDANCKTWQEYCKTLEGECDAGKVKGPIKFKGKEIMVGLLGKIPVPWSNVFEGSSGKEGRSEKSASLTTTVVAGVKETQASEYAGRGGVVGRRHGHSHWGY